MNPTLNGNKTYLGILLYAVGQALILLGLPEYGTPLSTIGETLTAAGAAHKVQKLIDATRGGGNERQDEGQMQGQG